MNWFYRLIGAASRTDTSGLDAPVAVSAATDQAGAAEAAATTGSAEVKNRCIAIMQSPEAVGRQSLAQHLALHTELPVGDALAVLRAFPSENVAATLPDSAAVSERADRQRRLSADFERVYRGAALAVPAVAEKPETVIERMQRNYNLARDEKPAAR